MDASGHLAVLLSMLHLFARLSSAQFVPPVTDLNLYSMLAPCAARAVKEDISVLSSKSECPSGDRQLQSCVCSETELFGQINRSVSKDVLSRCGSSAIDDIWSASKVLEQYCSPGATITFSTPTTNIVHTRINDMPEISRLAGCAQSAFRFGVLYAVKSHCPEAPSLYAPCLCSKSNVVDIMDKSLGDGVFERCDNKEDVAIATQFYSDYCAMNQGTTAFALHTPPGDMSYYISGLPQYQSLESCAQRGLSKEALYLTRYSCPEDPQGLASCICLKTGMYDEVYSGLTYTVSKECDGTSAVSSAIQVIDFYCSAAKNEVTATVTDTATYSYPTASAGAGSRTGSSAPPIETNGGNAGEQDESQGGGLSRDATIAVAVVASLVGLISIAAVFWFFRRRSKREAAAADQGGASALSNKPEMAGDSAFKAHPPQELATGLQAVEAQPSTGFVHELAAETPRRTLPQHTSY